MKTLLADAGSTKTDWLLRDNQGNALRFHTDGMNPSLLTDDEIRHILATQLLPQVEGLLIEQVDFYGAGCRGEAAERMKNLLGEVVGARNITVESDMLGAARMLCGNNSGIVCILGTGANSCLYDGQQISRQTPALGFILGDEGSGAVLGRRLIGDIFKGQLPEDLCKDFLLDYPLTMDELIRRVYRTSAPNQYLASFTPFLSKNIHRTEIQELIRDEFHRFIRRNVLAYLAYTTAETPLHFVGSIASVFQAHLCEVVAQYDFTLGKVVRQPIDALC
ncbi:MAG: ATPase [Alloprevotella sp.]|nr:ATPase [Alloprevotella sp.]